MKIGIDARGINWYRGTGIGTYTEKVLNNVLRMDHENYYDLFWSGKDFENFKKDNTKIIMTSKKQSRFFEQRYIPSNIKKENIDIYHAPQNGIGMCEDILCKKVITIHDLIPYIMPETVGRGYLTKFLREMPKIIAMADAIITVSEWSKKDILKFFPMDENKIFVTPLAADNKFRPLDKNKCRDFLFKNYDMVKPFILYIGGFSQRKNVKALISAFIDIHKDLNKDYDLIIIGANRDEFKNFNDPSNCNPLIKSNIKFTGFVPESHLPYFYNSCSSFVYPSLYEGFGLPPLEAMSCGAPVITSNTTSIPEVVGNTQLLINPYNIEELKEAIVKLLNNEELQEKLSTEGLIRSCQFSWVKTAEQTLEVYKNLATSSALRA